MERLKDLYEAIQSMQNQTRKPDEIIVSVDHNEELFEKLKTELSPEVKLVVNTGAQGISETRNAGIRASRGDIFAFIDDDAAAKKDWLENLTRHFCSPRVVAVGGKAIPIWPNGRRPTWFSDELHWIVGCTYKGLPLRRNEIRNVAGCNMSFRKEIFRDVGFFRSEFGRLGTSGAAEETEFCMRIRNKISRALILYEFRAVVYHKVSPQRATLEYVFTHSFIEGVCKAKLNTLFASLYPNPLSTESSYFRYLLLASIPERLKQLYKLEALCQIVVILLSIITTGIGYLVGKLKQAGQTTNEY